jgi:FlaG/FlaF family flagellin (archaellin)
MIGNTYPAMAKNIVTSLVAIESWHAASPKINLETHASGSDVVLDHDQVTLNLLEQCKESNVLPGGLHDDGVQQMMNAHRAQ